MSSQSKLPPQNLGRQEYLGRHSWNLLTCNGSCGSDKLVERLKWQFQKLSGVWVWTSIRMRNSWFEAVLKWLPHFGGFLLPGAPPASQGKDLRKSLPDSDRKIGRVILLNTARAVFTTKAYSPGELFLSELYLMWGKENIPLQPILVFQCYQRGTKTWETPVNVIAQGQRTTKRLGVNKRYTECVSSPFLTTMLIELQYNSIMENYSWKRYKTWTLSEQSYAGKTKI